MSQLYKDKPLLERYETIVGIDEVGRGCLAGPVFVGAYILNAETILVEGVTDSKMIPIKKRTILSELLKNSSSYILKDANTEEIDKGGIGKAITGLIEQIIEEVNDVYKNCLIIVDGQFASKFTTNTHKENKADLNYYSVGAASIIAKVARDAVMDKYHEEFPMYNFNKNKGYGTASHRKSLLEYGEIGLHRKSFKPVQRSMKNVR